MEFDPRQFAPAIERNRHLILPILQRVLPSVGTVLEIGSGTGEHAVYFAQALSGLNWQPSDTNPSALASIAAWIEHAGARNVAAPLALDVRAPEWPLARVDALVCINVIHYSPWASTPALLAGAARVLPADGIVYLYGPYRRAGRHTAPSNEAFDAWLKCRDPDFGVRDIEAVEAEAAACGLRLDEVIAMPANNFSLVLRRQRAG
ncbi:MAG: class I SAM-dependent methyltransferase [Azoarcus sp.]|jgi:cyclopropane fatty-acyl-phospholipid synthase-like methyltransferase|nr:class I SAM-dependent methyltransferase [Azoarcus sp.]